MTRHTMPSLIQQTIQLETGAGTIDGELVLPDHAVGVVLFAHGSGSSRHSPRNRFVAESLNHDGLGTLLIDLLTDQEGRRDAVTGMHRFDIRLLSDRLVVGSVWVGQQDATHELPLGYFGASTGGGAALVAAAERTDVAAVVSRGGRPDMAGESLRLVRSPTLLIVGGRDYPVIQLNEGALRLLERCEERKLVIIPGATHLFEEPGALEEVARVAGQWFRDHFAARSDKEIH
jgi:putative phosphoribosyl transferase